MTTPKIHPDFDWVVMKYHPLHPDVDAYRITHRRNIGAYDGESRRPKPQALANIRVAEKNLEYQKQFLAKLIAGAWETGDPVEEVTE